MTPDSKKHSVLLIDMGGPQSAEEVKPYLQKIFYDPYIIPGNPIKRWLLSRLIASKSAPETRERYAEIGGRSTAVDNAQKLGTQLTEHFSNLGLHLEYEVATRYSFPDIPEALEALVKKQDAPITVVYLFPQETTALTGSCEAVLMKAAQKLNVTITHSIKDLGTTEAYIEGWAEGINQAISKADKTFVMMTAHSLPVSIVNKECANCANHCECYVSRVEQSARLIREKLGEINSDLAYQSQEGPNWLGPTVEEKAKDAFDKGFRELIIAPLSFVGDNTETLLDIDKDLYEAIEPLGFERFKRIPPPDQRGFLSDMVAESLSQEWGLEARV